MVARLAPVVLVALLLAAAPAHAAVETFGSDLQAPATKVLPPNNGGLQESDPDYWGGADTSWWNIGLASGRSVTSPAEGQITTIRIKGSVVQNPDQNATQPEPWLHFQVYHPQPGAEPSYLIELTTGGKDDVLPLKPEAENYQGVTEFHPVNLCVHKGDLVGINSQGGYEFRHSGYNGTPYRVFGSPQNSTIDWYENHGKTNQGDVMPSGGEQIVGVGSSELLMETVVSSGPDSTDICPGGYREHVFLGTELIPYDPPAATVVTKSKIGRARLFCNFQNYGGCTGTMDIDATLNGVPTKLADDVPFELVAGGSKSVQYPLTPEQVLAIQKAGSVQARVTTDSHDNPADTRNTEKPGTRPGQQSKVNSYEYVLTPDSTTPIVVPLPPCTVPNLKGKTAKAAKTALTKAGCRLGTQKKKKTTSKKLIGKVISQSPAAKKKVANGTKVNVVIGKK